MPLSAGETAQRLRGIGFYCLALLCFACLDTSAKYVTQYVPVMEAAFARYAGATILIILALQPWRDYRPYLSKRPFLQTLRSLFLAASTIFNFLALRHLQLAETTTISFATPFVVAGLAGPFLGEWIGPRRWIAIVVGFIGVAIVTRPGPDGIQPAVLYAIGSMLANSFYLLLTRHLAPIDSPASLLLYPALSATIVLAPIALPGAVSPPTILVAVLLAATGLFGALGHWCVIRAHRLAPASLLAPFVYFQLLWMVTLGYFVFGDLPHQLTLVGAAIVIASGLYILYRQRVHGDR